MRGFLAIELDHETREFLCGIQKSLAEQDVKGNFSLRDNLHLTVKFLSEINAAQIEKVSEMIKNIASQYNLFVLTINSLGKFNKGNKMILWAGVKNHPFLQSLYRDADLQLRPIVPGLEEKNYFPHITLVREAVAQKPFSELRETIGAVDHPFTASGLSLMESTRVRGRLTYIRRVFEPFGAND